MTEESHRHRSIRFDEEFFYEDRLTGKETLVSKIEGHDLWNFRIRSSRELYSFNLIATRFDLESIIRVATEALENEDD